MNPPVSRCKTPTCPTISPDLTGVSARIVDWFGANARDLPWRREVTAYRVLVSEIMLQQTRVEAVKPYFLSFLEAFPTIEALSLADDGCLLKRWEGLGYYSRARNLKRCAAEIMTRFSGVIPRTVPELLSLPGIGPYTAGAIAAFAYGVPAPAVDGNVLRVMSRLVAEPGDILSPRVRASLTDLVASLVPADAPGAFGQGLIELGALLCVPNAAPRCELCPVAGFCRARELGLTDKIPFRHGKAERRVEERTVLLICSGDRLLLHKRPARGLLAGLWELPARLGRLSEPEAIAFARSLGVEPRSLEPLPEAKHLFTHIEWRMTGYRISVPEPALPFPDASYEMPDLETMTGSYALPSAFDPFLAALTGKT